MFIHYFLGSLHQGFFKAVFVVVAFAFASGAVFAKPLAYGFPECEFSVEFPTQPLLQRLQIESGLEIEQAIVIAEESFLRAECLPIEFETLIDSAEALTEMRKYALNHGLEAIETRFQKRSIGATTIVKGFKSISERRAIIDGQCIYGRRSILCMLAGTKADSYPTSEISAFLLSAKNVLLTPEPRWSPMSSGFRDVTIYVDTRSQTESLTGAHLIFLQEYTSQKMLPNGRLMKSATSHIEVFCAERGLKIHSVHAFSESMGRGDLVGVQSQTAVSQVGDPSSIPGLIYARTCGRSR